LHTNTYLCDVIGMIPATITSPTTGTCIRT